MNSYICLSKQRFDHEDRCIRTVQTSDIDSIRRWRNAQLDILRQVEPISCDEQVDYFIRHIWPDLGNSQPSNILVTYLVDLVPIGYGGLVHIDWTSKRAEVSFLVAPERAADPDTYETDFYRFLMLIQELAFQNIGLRKLYTETYDIRPHHIAVLEKAGFQRERVLREHISIAGKTVDSIIHGLLNYDEE
jgi:RimJ/RimL family protein N-acetyltransferase